MTTYTTVQTDYIIRREAALKRLTLLIEHITTVQATDYKTKNERDISRMAFLNEELMNITQHLGVEPRETPLLPHAPGERHVHHVEDQDLTTVRDVHLMMLDLMHDGYGDAPIEIDDRSCNTLWGYETNEEEDVDARVVHLFAIRTCIDD